MCDGDDLMYVFTYLAIYVPYTNVYSIILIDMTQEAP